MGLVFVLQCMQSKNYFDENRYDIKGKKFKNAKKVLCNRYRIKILYVR